MEKAREFQKTSTYASLTVLKSWPVWITTNYGKFLRYRSTRLPYLSSKKPVYGSRNNRARHGTTDWFKMGKGEWPGCMFNPAYLTYTQSTPCEMEVLMNQRLQSRLPVEISTISDMQMIPL